MTNSKLYLFPLSVAILFPVTFIITFSIAVAKEHINAFFSYISDTGTVAPEECIFSQLLNIAAVLIGITAYIRFKQVEQVAHSSRDTNKSMEKLNKVGLIFGCIAALGVSVVGCFQETHVILAHVIGASMAFMGGAIFMMIQGFLTLRTMPMFGSRGLAYFRIINGFLCAVLFIVSLATGMLSLRQFEGDDSLRWEAEDGGWTLRVTSTVTEWIVAALLDIYFLTFIPEFKRLTVQPFEFRIVEYADIHHKGQNGGSNSTQQKVVMQRVEYEERTQLETY